MFQHNLTPEFAIISVAVLNELMEALVAKGVLSRSDVRGIFTGAASEIAPFQNATAQRAVTVVDNHILPRFAEREGEQGASQFRRMNSLHATIEEFAAEGYTHVECYCPLAA